MTSRNHNNNNNNNNTSTRSTQRRVYNRVSHHDGEEEDEEFDTVVIANDEVHQHQPPESQLPSAASSTTLSSSSSRILPVTLSSAISSRGRNLLARTTRRPPAAAPTAPTPRSYHRIAASDDDVVVAPEPPVTDSNPTLTSISSTSSLASKSVDDEDNDEENSIVKSDPDEKATNLTVTILDYTQKKFTIPAHTQWTIAQFKVASARIHKVPVGLQRLIFRGKLLADEMTLHDAGIVESDLIVHLFPKPRVVINSNNNTNNNNSACTPSGGQGDNDNEGNDEEGARVPTIVMDANEAEQRAHILVLGSSEYIEAQNNVKLFSFMLLIISSIELLNLLAIALGVPQDEQGGAGGGSGSGAFAPGAGLDIDDIFPPQYNDDDWTNPNRNSTNHNSYGSSGSGGGYPHNSTDMAASLLYQSWGWMNTVDLIISLAGVYVAIMGIQASTENTLRLARVYLVGTFLVGVAWLLFNYFITVEINEAVEEDHRENHPNDDFIPDLSKNDIYAQALSVMVLPAMVWVMCCLRAAQFHHLLREAEEEAGARIQAELERSQNENGENINTAATVATPGSGDSGENDNDEEMALSSNQGSNNNNLPVLPRRHRITEPILT